MHVLRAPVGGLFRHVVDLIRGQAQRGHRVGVIVDHTTGGERASAVLAELAPQLQLGCTRVTIPREIGTDDLGALRRITPWIKERDPDVLHGHGAKGGALSRLVAGAPHAIRAYTPHGGSLAHFSGTSTRAPLSTPRVELEVAHRLFLFESGYIADVFRRSIGSPHCLANVVCCGIGDADFAPIRARPDATELVYLGELRMLKGIGILLDALALLKQSGRVVSATIAGEGSDEAILRAQTRQLGLDDAVNFVGYRTAREAFAMGRTLVFPSLGESLPYVVLEAAAAGLPLVATCVGGVPEIFGPFADQLIVPGDAGALAAAIGAGLDNGATTDHVARALQTRVREVFSVDAMVNGGLAGYREAIVVRRVRQSA